MEDFVCPYCGALLGDEYGECPYCGRVLKEKNERIKKKKMLFLKQVYEHRKPY